MGGNPQHQPAWETTTAPPVAVLSNEASSASSHAAETGRNSQSHSRQSSEVSSTAEKQTGAITSSTISNGKLSHDENTKLPLGESATATIKAVERHKRFTPNLRTLLSFAALTLSIFLVALDTVLIPTALPTISLSFYVRDSLYAWAGSAYLLANAASVPFWGKLSDVFGRKPIILVANCIFIGGSILCAISADAVMLVAGRTVQGLGGGGVVVLVHVCVADMFTIRDRSFYLGIVGAVWAVASALGPVLGGIFASKLGWRWCFWVNVPITSISTVLLFFTLNLRNPRTPILAGLLSIDWFGSITIIAATILLLAGLQLGGESTYQSPLVISFLVFGFFFFILFPCTQYLSEKRDKSPITPLRIFKDLSNLAALGVCACDALIFNSVAYFLPLYFQVVLSVSPFTSGTYMLANAIPLAIVSLLSGHVIEKTGRYLEILQAGLALMTFGIGLFITFSPTLSLERIIAFLVIVGLGFGPNFHAPLIALQTRIRESDIAAGTAAFGFVRMISGAIGVVVGQVVFQIQMRPHLDSFMSAGIGRGLAERLAGGEAIAEAGAVARLQAGQRATVRAGMTEALRGTWVVYTVVSGVGLLVSFGIKRTKLSREGSARQSFRDEEVNVASMEEVMLETK